MNVKLLRKIKKHILAEPNRLAMGIIERHGRPGTRLNCATPDLYNANNPFEQDQTFPACGTIACIHGWSYLLSNGEPIDIPMGKLIAADSWPEKFRNRYGKAKTPETRARIAAQRIDHFIKTKGRE